MLIKRGGKPPPFRKNAEERIVWQYLRLTKKHIKQNHLHII